jgi:hypothetical protein
MNKQDRNIAITIAIILLVCVVALVAIGNSLWLAIGPELGKIFGFVNNYVSIATVNYNFAVPGQNQTPSATPTTPDQPAVTPQATQNKHSVSINYNFKVPIFTAANISPDQIGLRDDILGDAKSANYVEEFMEFARLRVQIPKLQMDSPVQVGLPADYGLQNGFIFHPNSGEFDKGEVILLCYRQFRAPSDPISCWNLHSLQAGDEIFVLSNGVEVKYAVVGAGEFAANAEQLYSADKADPQYLKIVSAHPLNRLSQRIVVLAKRI